MRLEDVTAEIRPRSDWEAVDLGVALVRRDFWRLAGLWCLAMVPVLAAGVVLREHPFWWLVVLWWCKPVGARLALFDLSRTLFGERLAMGECLRRVWWVWWDRWWVWLGVARFSPRRPLVMAVADLEDLRGAALRERVRVVRRRGDGAVIGLTAVGCLLQGWLGLVVFGLAAIFVPEGQSDKWSEAFEMWVNGEAVAPPLLLGWSFALSMAPAMAAVDLFVSGAGFGIYLNNRSWIEGWDVELAFKRLAERLRKLGMAVVTGAVLWAGAAGQWAEAAETGRVVTEEEAGAAGGSDDDGGAGRDLADDLADAGDEQQVLEEVMADEAFRVRTRKLREREKGAEWRWPDWLKWNLPAGVHSLRQWMSMVFLVVVLAAVVAGLVWLIRRYRHVLGKGGAAEKAGAGGPAVVLAGLEGMPLRMPEDPPALAMLWWREGRKREAMALLYRAAILWFVERRQLEIGPSMTEEDCVRRVRLAGGGQQAEHFRHLTAAWILLAYGGRDVRESEWSELCEAWPYREEGGAA